MHLFWAGTLKTENNTVEIIAFRTNTTADFKPMLEKKLASLKAMTQTNNVKAQITFIQEVLRQMSDPVFVKTPDKQLLTVAARGLKLSALTKDDVVYLSGVTQVIK